LEELRKLSLLAPVDVVEKVMSRLAKLSGKFYQLIPMAEDKNSVTKPILHMNFLNELY